MTTNAVQTLDKASKHINSLYRQFGTWRKVAAIVGLPVGTVWNVAHGHDPKDIHTRAVLRLPALIPAPACRVCGEVHTTKRCTRRKLTDYEMLSDLAEMGMM